MTRIYSFCLVFIFLVFASFEIKGYLNYGTLGLSQNGNNTKQEIMANNEELQSGENENLNSTPKTEGLDGDKSLSLTPKTDDLDANENLDEIDDNANADAVDENADVVDENAYENKFNEKTNADNIDENADENKVDEKTDDDNACANVEDLNKVDPEKGENVQGNEGAGENDGKQFQSELENAKNTLCNLLNSFYTSLCKFDELSYFSLYFKDGKFNEGLLTTTDVSLVNNLINLSGQATEIAQNVITSNELAFGEPALDFDLLLINDCDANLFDEFQNELYVACQIREKLNDGSLLKYL